ncbi:unnamed protein product [Absidia cylindrospora]
MASLANGSGGGGWKMTLNRSRQNTTDFMTGEDLVRTIGSDYQEIQKRTLTKWLLKLLSVVARDPAPKPEKMNMRIHQLANVAQALSFLEKQLGADSIVDMGNEAIVNGDKKKTLALIFFIMIKYQIQVVLNDHGDDFTHSLLDYSDRQRDGLRIDVLSPTEPIGPTAQSTDKATAPTTPIPGTNSLASSKKHGSNYSINSDKQHTSSSESKLALLFWVRIQLEDYIAASIIPSIQDFSRSWRNGLAFCLLIHRHGSDLLPDLFSYHLKDADLSQKQTWRRLLALAFDLATEHMNIPRYLEPEDLADVDYPHEPSVMMYVAEFYKSMSSAQQKVSDDERHDIAIRRRTNIAMVTGGIDTLIYDDDHNDTPVLSDQHNDDYDTTKADSDKKKSNRKKAHRRSTLADEDKERIKADLNSRLMMQLTGHLPRGVHPVLDQLITIHETVLAFIKTNTRTLDEIPTSFDDADTVAEYLDALEIVEEQMQEESSLLDTARDARDKLMLAPENADDTLIRLTDLQRTQVKNLYDMLLNQWTDFEQLLSTTKTDLLRIESDLVDIEEGTQKYHGEADKVMARIEELLHILDQVVPRHSSDSGDEFQAGDLWHPLDEGNQDGQTKEISISFHQAATEANEQVDTFDSIMWKSYRRFILQFSRAVLKQVKSRLDELEQGHQHVMDTNRNTLSSSENFSCALDLIATTKGIGHELETIRELMDNNNYTTNDGISGLENQVNAVRTKIHKTRETYDGLLTKDDRLGGFVDQVQQQYEMVRDWVDQVRVWFVEAERIRKWIEIRIDIINQRNGSEDFDPLSDTLDEVARNSSEKWRDEHAKLTRDIDRFNGDDMARLRTHVKTLTGADRGGRDLGPADASTIEITLTTVNMLNQLMELLRKRSYMVDMLILRVQWDDLCGACSRWILDTDQEIDAFLKPGQARWICSDDDIENTSSDVEASLNNSNGNGNRRRIPGRTSSSAFNSLMDTEEMIQTLVALESKVIQYDQSEYTQCLDAFQEMEDLHNVDLPSSLDTKQTQFEDSFGDLMKRSGFARKVVEQHLALLDITTQYRQIWDKGESLRISMVNASKSTSTRTKTAGINDDDSDDSESDVYGEKVQNFKEDSSQLITNVFSQIMYTEVPSYTTLSVGSQDHEDNEQANHHIKETIQGYSMQLATIAEALENLLASNRRTLSLQQRATLAYEEMMRHIQWLDDRSQKYKKSWLSKMDYGSGSDLESDSDDDDSDNKTSTIQYQRELDSLIIRMEQLEEGELSRLRKRVSAIEDEIDASNTITIDRGTLINAIEQLDDSHERLRRLLERRAIDLVIIDKRQLWDEQTIVANDAMNNVARNLWSIVESIGVQADGADDNCDTTCGTLEEQRLLIKTIQDMPALCQDGCYSDLENAYLQLGASSGLPTHLKKKQQTIVTKQHDLEKLYLYVQESLEYKTQLNTLVAEMEDAAQQGNRVHEDLGKIYIPGTSSATGLNAHDDMLIEFMQLVESLAQKRIEIKSPENQSTMFHSERAIIIQDDEFIARINEWLDSKLGDFNLWSSQWNN